MVSCVKGEGNYLVNSPLSHRVSYVLLSAHSFQVAASPNPNWSLQVRRARLKRTLSCCVLPVRQDLIILTLSTGHVQKWFKIWDPNPILASRHQAFHYKSFGLLRLTLTVYNKCKKIFTIVKLCSTEEFRVAKCYLYAFTFLWKMKVKQITRLIHIISLWSIDC